MSKTLRYLEIFFLALAVPAMIVTDWYIAGYGVLVMFILIGIGLAFDQSKRIIDRPKDVGNIDKFIKNRILKIFALEFFLMSPMVLIYIGKISEKTGFVFFCIFIIIGIIFDQIARISFKYKT